MKHDYDFVWKAFEEAQESMTVLKNGEAYQTIIHALKLAAKVTGEPSEGMIELGFRKFQGFAKPGNAMCNGFREMIAQAEREIEG